MDIDENKGRIVFDDAHYGETHFGVKDGSRLSPEEYEVFFRSLRSPRRLHETNFYQWRIPVMGIRHEGNETIKTVSFLKFRYETPEQVAKDAADKAALAANLKPVSDPWRMFD